MISRPTARSACSRRHSTAASTYSATWFDWNSVTSWPETNIRVILEPSTFRSVSIHTRVDNWRTSRIISNTPLTRIPRIEGGHGRTGKHWLPSSQNAPTECKQPVLDLSVSLTQTRHVGSVGYIIRYSIFAAAIQEVSGMHWSSCQKLSTRHTNALCEDLKEPRQTQNLRADCFSASPSLPGRSMPRNWQSFSHLISRRDQFQNSARIGSWNIRWKQCCPLAPHWFPSSMLTIPRSYSSPTFLSRSSWRLPDLPRNTTPFTAVTTFLWRQLIPSSREHVGVFYYTWMNMSPRTAWRNIPLSDVPARTGFSMPILRASGCGRIDETAIWCTVNITRFVHPKTMSNSQNRYKIFSLSTIKNSFDKTSNLYV